MMLMPTKILHLYYSTNNSSIVHPFPFFRPFFTYYACSCSLYNLKKELHDNNENGNDTRTLCQIPCFKNGCIEISPFPFVELHFSCHSYNVVVTSLL